MNLSMDLSDGEWKVSPHDFERNGWRFWLCRQCFAPRSLHPRREWVKARLANRNEYIDKGAPHFKEGW